MATMEDRQRYEERKIDPITVTRRQRHESDQALCAAGPTPEPREAAREEPAPQERAKLIVDEPRQPVTLTLTTRFDAEGLEVIADDVVEHRRD